MLCLKVAGYVANRVDPDEMPCSAASHLDLHCLLRLICQNTYDKYIMSKDTCQMQMGCMTFAAYFFFE